MKIYKMIFAAIAANLAVAAGLSASPVNAYSVDQRKWPGTSVNYFIAPQFSSAGTGWLTTLNAATDSWLSSGGFTFIQSASLSYVTAGALGCQGTPIAITALYQTSQWEMQKWYTQVNTSACFGPFYDGTQAPTLPLNYISLQTVLKHELGHVIGLGHINNPAWLMNHSIDPGVARGVDLEATRAKDYLYNSAYTGNSPSTIYYGGTTPPYVNPSIGTYEDNSVVTYFGGPLTAWSHLTGVAGVGGGTMAKTSVSGAKVTIPFYGTRISRVYTMGPDRGCGQVFIDFTAVTSACDTNSWYRKQSQQNFDVPLGNHVFEIRNSTGGSLDVDQFIVDTPAPSGGFENNSGQSMYFGTGWVHQTGSGASGGTNSYTQVAGDIVKTTCYGNKIVFWYTRAANRGYMSFVLDGFEWAVYDAYSLNTQWQQKATFYPVQGTHTIAMMNLGQKNSLSSGYFVDIDRIECTTI